MEYQLLDAAASAAVLAITKTAVYRLVERRRIPYYRLPSGLRFRRSDLDAYLRERRVEPEPRRYGNP